jgi:hypothetical protein
MRRALRENAPCALLALAGCATLAWLGLYGFTWTDYEAETQPSLEALVHGHLALFLQLAPVYGGSLIERAPFALLPSLWGGGALAVYRAVALPCLLAVAAIAVVLVAAMRAEGKPRLARGLVLGLLVANPISLLALETGHPEELLGGALCLGAILLAAGDEISRRRALLAGLALGLAVANKQWAVLAAGPVLLALPASRRLACGAAALAVAAAIEAPLLIGASSSYVHASANAAAGSSVFQPWQLWWLFGHHGPLVHGLFGAAKPGYRTGPGWTGTISHPLVLAVGLAVPAGLWLWRRPARLTAAAALLMFALVMVLRCLLDTWDIGYYMVPALFALAAWEARTPGERPPVAALVVTLLAWLSFSWLPTRVSPDAQSAAFLAWCLPLAALLAWRLIALVPARGSTETPGGAQPALALRRRGLGLPAQETTVRPFGSPVSTSHPAARTTARSSMRTPSASGR